MVRAAALHREVRISVPVCAGRVWADVPDQRDRYWRCAGRKLRQRRAQGALPGPDAVAEYGRDFQGCSIHDRARRRLRPRQQRGGGQARGRISGGSTATNGFAPQFDGDVVLLLARPDGAPAGSTRARALPDAASIGKRRAQQLSDRQAQGQIGHALDGQRRSRARGRARLPARRARPRPPPDDGHG